MRFVYADRGGEDTGEILSTKYEMPNNIQAIMSKTQNEQAFWHLHLGF